MINRILNRISDDILAQGVEGQQEAQTVLSFFERERARALGQKSRQFVSEAQEEIEYFKSKTELIQLRRKVPAFEHMLSQLETTDPDYSDFKHELYTNNRRLEMLEKEMEGTKPTDFFKDLIAFSRSEEYVELYDALAERVGKWFEEGHAGPGSISYNGHIYTSKVS